MVVFNVSEIVNKHEEPDDTTEEKLANKVVKRIVSDSEPDVSGGFDDYEGVASDGGFGNDDY
jgi:hypothetical protein